MPAGSTSAASKPGLLGGGLALLLEPEALEAEALSHAPETDASAARPPTAAELRARRITELAGYGPEPKGPLGSIPYCVRVMLRRRELDAKLDAFAEQCKHADAQAEDALVRVGLALLQMHGDARLEPLAARMQKVVDARDALGEVAATGQEYEQSARSALAELDAQIAPLEAEVTELRGHEARAQAQVDALSARAREAEARRLQAEQEIQFLRAKEPVDRVRLSALAAEREARNAEQRMLEVQISPSQTELVEAQRELAGPLAAWQELYERRAAVSDEAGRTEATLRAHSDAARGAERTALVGVARAALMADLAGFAGEAAEVADDALAQARALRDEEDIHKKAREDYDEDAYRQGLGILVGTSVVAFVVFAGLILF